MRHSKPEQLFKRAYELTTQEYMESILVSNDVAENVLGWEELHRMRERVRDHERQQVISAIARLRPRRDARASFFISYAKAVIDRKDAQASLLRRLNGMAESLRDDGILPDREELEEAQELTETISRLDAHIERQEKAMAIHFEQGTDPMIALLSIE